MTVGERIKQRRIELGMSQEELAEKMGYSGKSSVCKAETSGDGVTTSKISRFAKALATTPAYLMGWDDEPISMEEKETINPVLMDKYNELPQEYKSIIDNTINSVYDAWKKTL